MRLGYPPQVYLEPLRPGEPLSLSIAVSHRAAALYVNLLNCGFASKNEQRLVPYPGSLSRNGLYAFGLARIREPVRDYYG